MGLHVLKACALAALALAAAAHAQGYPAKPLRMIVAYPPGGGTDIVGRMVAQKLGETFGQSVVVENRGGASGNIGTELAARAAPDGYTVLMGNVAPNAINVSLFKDLPFDPVADFEPVSLVASTPHVKSGKLAPIAVTSARRSRALPDAPTIAESGVAGYEASTWYGLLAPARTPGVAVARLHQATVKILADPALREKLADQGFEP